MNVQFEIQKLSIDKRLEELDGDLAALSFLYDGEMVENLNVMYDCIPMMKKAVKNHDVNLFVQGYGYYKNAYGNFKEIREKIKEKNN
ncbi:hypothetical protein [Gottfriedia acidiceleris]|uniref:hypothetical protein n=1 Tax=Gottfriedia acidiceleris TaxID=371036 RepID=UPI002FFD927A